jgi:BioD-like phosphotransacetylase family protein
MRSLYIVGTQQHVGKTTMAIGLTHAFRQRGLGVGYLKPLGQRLGRSRSKMLDEDARVIAGLMGRPAAELVDMAVPLPGGRVEREIQDLDSDALMQRVVANHAKVAEGNDLVVIESMGHVAAGACLGLASPDIARALGAKVLLVAEGGIGRTIDDISLCATYVQARGGELAGVIVNKVWPQNYRRIREATARGLANLGLRSFGTVPFETRLSSPTLAQVHERLGGEVLGGADHFDRRVRRTIVAAVKAEHVLPYIEHATLVITPGDRTDSIRATLRAHGSGGPGDLQVAGLILTCGFRPEAELMDPIRDGHLPVILVEEDTYTIASRLRNTVFKITPNDEERMQWAVCLVGAFVEIDALHELLAD